MVKNSYVPFLESAVDMQFNSSDPRRSETLSVGNRSSGLIFDSGILRPSTTSAAETFAECA